MNPRIVLMYGMGGALVEWWANGNRLLETRLRAIGFQTLLVNWNERQKAYDFLHGHTGKIALCGDSLGAGSAAQYAGDHQRAVDFVGGFQPSDYDTRAKRKTILVPLNVVRAHCIYDPRFVDTLGLGQSQYVLPPKSKTILTTTQHPGAHPDNWGVAQDIMFNDIKAHVS